MAEQAKIQSWTCEGCDTVRPWGEPRCFYCGNLPPHVVLQARVDEARATIARVRAWAERCEDDGSKYVHIEQVLSQHENCEFVPPDTTEGRNE